MKKNECFSLTAERLGADLEGVCIHDGMPVFVPGMLPGETATVLVGLFPHGCRAKAEQ